MTFREAERIFIDSVSPVYDRQEASSLSWLSISFICKLERTQYLNLKDTEIPSNKAKALFEVLEQLKTGKPLQYILGETEFYGLNFKVNPSVLIPRPETEELVEWILSDIRSSISSLEGLKIIDIGTGSACIPVSIKKHVPSAKVYAVDISPDALNTARQNAVLNQTEVILIQDDLLNPVNNELIHTKYRIIVSNPPYVTVTEKDQMLSNVLEHEPHLALFVPDNDPLLFYRALADFALRHAESNGLLYLEINENLGAETLSLLKEKGFKNLELRKDLRGKDRMIRAELF